MSYPNKTSADSFNYTLERYCKTCSNTFSGRYCNRCGEKVEDPEEKSMLNLLGKFMDGITHFDNKFFRTLKLIITRPGQLSTNFINGIKVPYMRPIFIFLIANLLYFLFPVFNTFNSQLRTQMHFLPHSDIASQVVEQKIKNEHTTLEDFTIRYQQQSTNMAKLFLIVFVILVAIPLTLLNHTRHFYFQDHVLVSLEYNSVALLVTQVFLPWILVVVDQFAHAEFLFSEAYYSALIGIFSWVILFYIEKRVYTQSKRSAQIKATLMVLSLFICLQVYRGILFLVTMLTL